MSSDAEIWRAARDLIADYGPKRAESHASRQLNDMTQNNDFAGMLVWRRILRAVKGLNSNSLKTASGRR